MGDRKSGDQMGSGPNALQPFDGALLVYTKMLHVFNSWTDLAINFVIVKSTMIPD